MKEVGAQVPFKACQDEGSVQLSATAGFLSEGGQLVTAVGSVRSPFLSCC